MGGTINPMPQTVTPMLHVPDVQAAIDWYVGLGFALNASGSDGHDVIWASLSYGGSEIMLNAGEALRAARRREADLYIRTDNVDDLYVRLRDRAEVVEQPHDTFYGMHELIIRDLNGFWITFGRPVEG